LKSELRPDQQILELFRNDATKEKAFALLMGEYQQPVYWLIRRMVMDHEDANDLTQDTFVKIWHHLGEFREESKLFSWIYRIAANEALMFLKKQKVRSFIPFGKVEYKLRNSLQEDQYFKGDEVQRKLQQCIDMLPPQQKLIFTLRYYQELKYEEMAEILKLSTGALKASYHHAVKKIEKNLLSL